MNILALDTATGVFSVALTTEKGLWYSEIDSGSSHSELLMECVDGLFKLSNSDASCLNLISCMKGPGSFTGLRIGFSAAKGMAMALGIPYISIPTLDCMAYPFSNWPGLVLPVIDAKKSRFFSAFYRSSIRLTDYSDLAPEEILDLLEKTRNFADEPLLLTGPGAELLLSRFNFQLNHSIIFPEFNRGRAWELLQVSKSVNIKDRTEIDLGPVYLRKSDAELSKSQYSSML